uniref:Rapunzel 2 n=1 Tax=Fundulus heteroclitus TaxID=8078 RepID=A0A3Q2T4H1_FUNHE
MVDNIKDTAVKVLGCVDKLASFASSIHPMFTVVSSVVRVARKGLMKKGPNPPDKDFQAIHDKLESISKKNHEALNNIRINEVNETYGKYEEYIKYQYDAFITMMAEVNKNPDNSEVYMETFKNTYEKTKLDMGLDVFYRGVIGTDAVFARPLLDVYFENCDGDREIMERRCSHIAHLFHIGLIALMGYTAVTYDDEDGVREKWSDKMSEIQNKMEEVLSKCKNK